MKQKLTITGSERLDLASKSRHIAVIPGHLKVLQQERIVEHFKHSAWEVVGGRRRASVEIHVYQERLGALKNHGRRLRHFLREVGSCASVERGKRLSCWIGRVVLAHGRIRQDRASGQYVQEAG